MAKTVSILGLGWLGKPLAYSLLAKGYLVKGSVTSVEKTIEFSGSGIELSVLNIDQNGINASDSNFFETDVLYINIPPRRIPEIETVYPAQIRQLLPYIISNDIKKVIFISSTSVYPEVNQIATETDQLEPEKGSGVACLNAEQTLQNEESFLTTVIRFGGLIGANRNPYRFMQHGSKNGAPEKPVNLIHLDDCIGIIEHVIENEIWGEVINGCSPMHPTRKEFYELAAKIAKAELPVFEQNIPYKFKKVSSSKVINKLGYSFKYKSPLDYLSTL